MPATFSEDDRALVEFWDMAFRDDGGETGGQLRDADGLRSLAPSEKLYLAAAGLGSCRRILDYGCGSGWAGITAAVSGCPDVTAADPAEGAVRAAERSIRAFGVSDRVRAVHISHDWLGGEEPGSYDGMICSNVLDVVPPATAQYIISSAADALHSGSPAVIGMNYFLPQQEAEQRGIELVCGRMVYMDGVLRLVSRTDREWEELFSERFEVERLEHFAWPGEKEERRRLFFLRKK